MNYASMASEVTSQFQSGEWVAEEGSNIRGRIVRPGDFAGEWRIRLVDGGETACLGENLTRISEPTLPQTLGRPAGGDELLKDLPNGHP